MSVMIVDRPPTAGKNCLFNLSVICLFERLVITHFGVQGRVILVLIATCPKQCLSIPFYCVLIGNSIIEQCRKCPRAAAFYQDLQLLPMVLAER